MMQVNDDFASMVRSTNLLIKKGLIEQAKPIVFKIDDTIINDVDNLKPQNVVKALATIIIFYNIEDVYTKDFERTSLFFNRLPGYISIYKNIFEDFLSIPAESENEAFVHAIIYNHLGLLYSSLELHDKAEKNYNSAINLLTHFKRDNTGLMATVLCNLGLTNMLQDKENEAIDLWHKAYDIQNTMDRFYTPCTAAILTCLSTCVKKIDEAETYVKKAIKIRQRIYPPDAPEHSESFMAAAEKFNERGEYRKAIVYYKKALQAQQRKINVDHREIFRTIYLLAFLYIRMRNYKMAYKYFIEAQTEETRWINQKVFILNDQDRQEFLANTYEYLAIFLTFTNGFLNMNQKAIVAAYNIYLSRKGLLLETDKVFRESIMNDAPPEIKIINEKLNQIRSHLTSAYHMSNDKIQQNKEDLTELNKKKDALENEMRRYYEPYGLEKKVLEAKLDKIVNYLPTDAILIEFAEIETYDFEKEMIEPSHYYAFIVSKGHSCKVILKDLGKSDDINTDIKKIRYLISHFVNINDHRSLQRDESEKIREISKALYDAVFLPIKEHLKKKKRIFICPDGDINLLPFEILVDSEDHYLIENYTFNYLTSGRDLLRLNLERKQTESSAARGKIVLMGNPDYDLILKKSKPKESNKREYNIYLRSLPGTAEEITEISKLFKKDETLVYTGKDASEEVLRLIKSPKILHLATHGFFLPMSADNNKTRSISDRNIEEEKEKMIVEMGNPLLCSGIALAGFNAANNSDCFNDGVVTAEEILGYDFSATELVTLSACETGVGKIGMGQGVFGLRSAFARAGVLAMIMSLWNVPDKETKDLMVNFYTNMVTSGMSKDEALRNAALKVMKEIKEKHGHTHPMFWGSFIFTGLPN